MLPPVKGGEFARELAKSRKAATDLYERLSEHPDFVPIMEPETDIVVWALKGDSTLAMSERAHEVFDRAEANHLYLSLYKYPTDKLTHWEVEIDAEYVTCLRSCLMKPEHTDWMDDIWERLEKALD